jgi:stage IV sporulation protein A
LGEVEDSGYGVTTPTMEDIIFEEPELYRQGHRFGVRLRAAAPSIHMIKANIWAEVTPFVGTEKQGEQMLRYLTDEFEKDPAKIWNSEFLGKPMHELIKESLETKLTRMPEASRVKLQEALTKIVNEGSGGLICIII